MNDLPGRGDVNPYGIPVPNPHEQEGPEPCEMCGGNGYVLDPKPGDGMSGGDSKPCPDCNPDG